MGRPRKYASDAERVAAYRARKKAEGNGSPAEPKPEPRTPGDVFAQAAAIGAYQHAAQERRRIAKLRSYLQTKVKPADVETTLATMEQAREERIAGYALWDDAERDRRERYDARTQAALRAA